MKSNNKPPHWNDDEDTYWNKCHSGFSLDDSKPRYNYNELTKFSARSKNQTPGANKLNIDSNAVSNFSYDEIDLPQLKCEACKNIITDSDDIMSEGDKMFTNEQCWKHYIDRAIDTEDFNLTNFPSTAARRYMLNKICSTHNGRLITKFVLSLKRNMDEFQFGSLIYDSNTAYDHYMSFLRESGQNDPKLLRCKNQIEEIMRKLNDIFLDNFGVDEATVDNLIRQLSEFRDEMQLNFNFTVQTELITEYINMLEYQKQVDPMLINRSLISTLSEGVSYDAFQKNTTLRLQKFKITPEEFFWTTVVSVVKQGRTSDFDKLLNHKGFGSKPDIEVERIVAFLVSLDTLGLVPQRELYEAKMKCLGKISNIGDMVACANTYKLLPSFIQYCEHNNDKSLLKKIHQFHK